MHGISRSRWSIFVGLSEMSQQSLNIIAVRLAQRGLIVRYDPANDSLICARHAAVAGTSFGHWVSSYLAGIGSVDFLTDTPFATITRKRRPIRWLFDISIAAAPIPGPVFFHETFATPEAAGEAVIHDSSNSSEVVR